MSSVNIGKHQIDRFRFLFGAILMIIVLRPFLDQWLNDRILMDIFTDIFFACALIAGLHAVKGQPNQFRVVILLIITITLLSVLHYTLKIPALDRLQLGLGAVFFIQMLVMIATHIKNENEVTFDLIMAAACTYVLIGMVWSYSYYFLEIFHPGSFKAADKPLEDLWYFYYYSFVTLTTVGYGDIVANTKPAQALTILEAIVGQLYLAILISRLVGLYSSQAQAKTEE